MKQWAIVALVVTVPACATPQEQTYAQQVLARPLPRTDDARLRECMAIRSEIGKQQNLAQFGLNMMMDITPEISADAQADARDNLAALQERSSQVNCTAVFSGDVRSTPSAPAQH